MVWLYIESCIYMCTVKVYLQILIGNNLKKLVDFLVSHYLGHHHSLMLVWNWNVRTTEPVEYCEDENQKCSKWIAIYFQIYFFVCFVESKGDCHWMSHICQQFIVIYINYIYTNEFNKLEASTSQKSFCYLCENFVVLKHEIMTGVKVVSTSPTVDDYVYMSSDHDCMYML